MVKNAKLFRYDTRWKLFPGFKQVIDQVCAQEGTPLSIGDIDNIVKKCRNALSWQRSKNNTNSEKQIAQLKQDIHKAYEAPCIDYVLLADLNTQLQFRRNSGEQKIELCGYTLKIGTLNTSTPRKRREETIIRLCISKMIKGRSIVNQKPFIIIYKSVFIIFVAVREQEYVLN